METTQRPIRAQTQKEKSCIFVTIIRKKDNESKEKPRRVIKLLDIKT